MIRIKNWERFQHFKERKPPWIKLYRDILDDPDWHVLNGDSAKKLVMLWLIASENDGYLPDMRKLAFRLRISESATSQLLNRLEQWLVQDDIKMISTRYQDDTPETETETEAEAEQRPSKKNTLNTKQQGLFDRFWSEYPKKRSKGQAEWAFAKLNPSEQLVETMLSTIRRAKTSEDWQKSNGQYIPYPATWLNARGWEDDYRINTQNRPSQELRTW